MITMRGMDPARTLAEREQFFFSGGGFRNNRVFLHTCNRVELYEGEGAVPPAVAKHLFRVVCGIESVMVGETAVQGQVKCAYDAARANASLSPSLHRLFQYALRVGKRIRTETSLSKGAMVHGKAVIEILRQENIPEKKSRVLVIGVNNLNASIIKYLSEKGNRTVFVANRTFEKALALSAEYRCAAAPFSQLKEYLSLTDVLVSATSAPHLILRNEDFTATQPIAVFDLAVPRDIDPEIGMRANVKLFNIEDIERRVGSNRDKRRAEVKKAERIIEEEVALFYEK
jgi:glutamyl-tRNA reductase